MAESGKRQRRLSDGYSFAGFRARVTVRGVFGDPNVRIVRLDRRSKKRLAVVAGAFCCASLRILPTVRHADYLGGWLDVLREDNRAIIRAALQASKAADYILGFLPEVQPSVADEASTEQRAA
jgi:antirestriction protein ArdC